MTEQDFFKLIAEEEQIKLEQVQATVALLDEENTVPFIARYRKEVTGGLDETKIIAIQDRVRYLRMLEERKQTVLKSIEEQGKLTDDLRAKIEAAPKLQDVEDLYLPYKPKKRTRATRSEIECPYAPAFPYTAAPTQPGIPASVSRPFNPRALAKSTRS